MQPDVASRKIEQDYIHVMQFLGSRQSKEHSDLLCSIFLVMFSPTFSIWQPCPEGTSACSLQPAAEVLPTGPGGMVQGPEERGGAHPPSNVPLWVIFWAMFYLSQWFSNRLVSEKSVTPALHSFTSFEHMDNLAESSRLITCQWSCRKTIQNTLKDPKGPKSW